MKKIWYILEVGSHRGPFEFNELELMFKHSKLKLDQLVWKEGLPAGIMFKDLMAMEQSKVEQGIPDIPTEAKLPILNENTPKIIPGMPESLKTVVSAPRPVKSDEGSANQMVLPEIKKTSGTKIFRIYLASFVAIVLMVIAVIFYQYSLKTPTLTQPLSMLSPDYERLSEVIKLRHQKNFVHELAVSKTFEEFWLATNYPYAGKLKIQFRSYPEKTTKKTLIEGSAEAELSSFFATFSPLTFTQGERLLQGIYQIKIKLVEEFDSNLIQRLVYKTREFPLVEFDYYVGFGNQDEFLARLQQIGGEEPTEEIETQDVLTLVEKAERIRTLLTLINMTDEKTAQVFSDVKKKKLFGKTKELAKLVDEYEGAYVNEVAPLLSSLGQETNLELSKEFGSHFMGTLTFLRTFQKQKKPSQKKFESFGQESLLRFKEFTANLEQDLKQLESKIVELKAQTPQK